MSQHIIVHYGELRLKGRNRVKFEDRLISNIRNKCGGRVQRLSSSLLCSDCDINKFRFISGISWYADCIKIDKNYQNLINYFKENELSELKGSKSFGLVIKRSDKNFEYDSRQIAVNLGELIRKKYELSVDLDHPDIRIYIEINEYILIYFERITGLGGFPTGINGRVLCLLSGGVDSPVAAYELMRKGCNVDFIHFHVFNDNQRVLESKIIDLCKKLNYYQTVSKIFIVPNCIFDLAIIKNNDIHGYEMILFRRFMHKIAGIIALNNNYSALVNGDSLGQVASQTIENLSVLALDLQSYIFQPLIIYDKNDIIEISKAIGTYDISIQDYKDCCSIISKNPVIKSDINKIRLLENQIDIDALINKTINLISVYDIEC